MKYQIKSGFQYFIAKMLVRFKLIKNVPMEIEEINQIFLPQMPVSFEIPIPGGEGELSLLNVECSLNNSSDLITANLLCNFSVKINKTAIYNSHLMLILNSKIDYCRINKTISPIDLKIGSLELISDKYSMIKDTKKLITGFLPEPIKTIFNTTMLTTGVLLETVGVNEMVKYLTLYLTGSKQRILDYHQLDIENRIIKFAKSEAFAYHLDETDYDEQLFAELGEQVIIKDQQLLFVFHPEIK